MIDLSYLEQFAPKTLKKLTHKEAEALKKALEELEQLYGTKK